MRPEVNFAIVPTGQAYLHQNLGMRKDARTINKVIDAVIATHP